METDVIIIVGVVAIVAAIVLGFFNKDIQVTIKMEDEGYPIKDDGVEELEVRPKRKYTKRKTVSTKKPVITKKPIGRPKKTK